MNEHGSRQAEGTGLWRDSLSALLAGAVPASAQTGGLTGKATQRDGTPCVKCQVLIERQEIKGNYHVNTNKKGEYTYIGLPLGTYKITLKSATGETLYYIEDKVGMGDPKEVNFDLPKLAAEDQKRPQSEGGSRPAASANPGAPAAGPVPGANGGAPQQGAPQQQAQQTQQQQQQEQQQFASLKAGFEQGKAAYDQKNYTEAAADFEKALPMAKDAKNQLVILSRLADSYGKAKQYDKAIDNFQKALALNPNDAELHNALGNTYAEMNKTAEAQAEFQKSAQLDPAAASRAYFNLGAIMYNQGKMDEAAEAFKKATEANPQYADAYFLEGRALMAKLTLDAKTGKVIPAPGTQEALETYLKLAPTGANAADAQAMLQTITGTVDTQYKKAKKK